MNLETKDICIVIIDSDDQSRNSLKNALIQKEYRVGTSKSAEAGLSIISEMYPDLIIIDLVLPGMSGIDLLKKLAANPYMKKIPAIVLSAVTDKTIVVASLKAGAREYFVKPFNLKTILDKTLDMIKQYRQSQIKKEKHQDSVKLMRSQSVSLFEFQLLPDQQTIDFF